jgi:hypothetical protein
VPAKDSVPCVASSALPSRRRARTSTRRILRNARK